MKSTGAQSSDELQWIEYLDGYLFSSLSAGRQSYRS